MRALPSLAVAALHGAVLLVAWAAPPRERAPAARRELAVRLLPVTAAPAPAGAGAAPPPLQPLPAVVPVPPPGFAVLAEAPPAPAPVLVAAAAPVPVTLTAPPVPLDEPRAAEPALHPARRAACAPAPHPPVLQERGIEGVVRLRVWVDELGRAGQVLLAASSGWRLFDEAALAQARRCPFQPALRGTQPVGSWVEFPVRFALETSSNG